MKMVLVTWDDICSTSNPIWQENGELKNLVIIPCVTVGLLKEETPESLRIVLTSSPGHFSQATTIPKTCVKKVYELKVK